MKDLAVDERILKGMLKKEEVIGWTGFVSVIQGKWRALANTKMKVRVP